jgi:hypothetical protein
MKDIDEISYKLGAIHSDVSTLVESVKELRDYQREMNGKVKKAHDLINEIAPHVEDYKTTKRHAIMALFGLGGLTGIIGGKISSVLTNFFQ